MLWTVFIDVFNDYSVILSEFLQSEMEEGKEDGEKGPQGSPFSPFPYGSPLQRASTASRQTSYTGSPAQKILLSTFNR